MKPPGLTKPWWDHDLSGSVDVADFVILLNWENTLVLSDSLGSEDGQKQSDEKVSAETFRIEHSHGSFCLG